jgi:biotin operon repressor
VLESGFVRIYRSLLNWEWYDDANTMRVFLHLILTANWEPKKWHGITIERGQRVYSRSKLAAELKMSEQSVRTAINHLISTGEVTNDSTREYSIVTIKNYELYQQSTSELTNDQPTSNQRPTNDQPQFNKDKNDKKDKKDKKNIYSKIFSEYAAGDLELLKALNDFAEMRKAIKKPLSTERAARMLIHSLDKYADDNKTKIAILNQSIFKNWQGVFPLKEDDYHGQSANNAGNYVKGSADCAEEVPKYGKVY